MNIGAFYLVFLDEQDSKSDTYLCPTKKQEPLLLHHEMKQESGSGKKKVSAKKQKSDSGNKHLFNPPHCIVKYCNLNPIMHFILVICFKTATCATEQSCCSL